MKEALIIRYNRGSALIEVLVAIVILSLGISAAILLAFANQTLKADAKTNNEALLKAQKMMEDARADSRGNFIGVNSIATTTNAIYATSTYVTDYSQCLKEFTSFVNWTGDVARKEKIQLKTYLGDISGVVAIGGDCNVVSSIDWKNPQRFASDTFTPGKPTTIDVLNKIAYLGEDKSPFLKIADTHGAFLGQTGGLIFAYSNGFNALNKINDLDSIKWQNPLTGTSKYYVFTAMDTGTKQLKVVDVTDAHNPINVATTSLSSCVTGSFPEGWRIKYYGNKLYIVTRETAGPEFHIFDASTPSNPVEYGSGACKGFALNDTVENMVIHDQVVGGTLRRFAYLATDENNKELRVLDVTNPLTITEITAANQDLPGAQDGLSVFMLGNKLYFGRQSTPSGPDLYVYDIINPTTGLTLLGSQDINASVIDIHVTGRTIFLVTSKVNKEVQIWDNTNLSNIKLVKEYNFTNISDKGMDYESNFLYITGNSTPNFQILYDAP